MNTFTKDLRFGFRMLWKDRVFAAAALTTMALGIAATTVIFSIVQAVLFRPLPFREASRLVLINEGIPKADLPRIPFSAPDLLVYQKIQTSCEELAAFQCTEYSVTGSSVPERVRGARVSPNLFGLLGVEAELGRGFRPEEDLPGEGVVILGHGYWMRRFGGDRSVIGKTIRLNRNVSTIVGVMPGSFSFPLAGIPFNNQAADLFVPMGFTQLDRESQGSMYINSVIGRLKPDVTVEGARAEAAGLAGRILDTYPAKLRELINVQALSVDPLHETVVGDVRAPLLVLLGAVVLVVLIGCANVANLLLARAAARQKEIAIREALGASFWRLVRQMLSEGLALSLLGGALGVALAFAGQSLFLSWLPASLPRAGEIGIDGIVLLFILGVTLLTTLVFGLAPGLMASRLHLQAALAEDGRSGGTSRGRRRLQEAFVMLQVALAVVLLTGASLMIRSFSRLLEADPGFGARNALTFTLTVPHNAFPKAAAIRSFYDQSLAGIAGLPGVTGVAAASALPLERGETHPVEAEGPPRQSGEGARSATHTWVQGDYFAALKIPLLKGRTFTPADRAGQLPVVLVNQSLARMLWPGQDPVGKRIRWNEGAPWLTVVGIVADVSDAALHIPPNPRSYSPYEQEEDRILEFPVGDFLRSQRIVVNTDGDPLILLPEIRKLVARLDPEIALADVRRMDDRLAEAVAPQRFSMTLISCFAFLALVLSAVGIYGVMAGSVVQRTREIGIRTALGARGADILKLILGKTLQMTAVGLLAGLACAFAAVRLLESQLYGIEATDPATFCSVPLLLAAVGLLAGLIPAVRATRIEPMTALHYE